MNEHVHDAEAIFLAALEKSLPERSGYVEEACAGDSALLQQVRELLACHDHSRGPLDAPPPGLAGTIEMPAAGEQLGTIIGQYKLLQQIGEGGMGVVYLAAQTEPVQRKVALKVIKPGMDSRQVIARFEAERQALAVMDHVNIARVIDGGTTASGRPYFVMELIDGVPITKYCDDNHLTPRERLELFVPVCQAIQHAHQKGIIHRDIKPSNVLVTLYDGKPVPKVIDFGVAKAIDQKLTDQTLFTHFGTMVGTLEYMSPEQAEASVLGIDTRSDIYSLGVLLYELLTGSTPLTRKRLKEAANLEILRMIKEEEPQKPSTRLSESGDALASISAMRNMEPAKLSKLVRGELDWIVMKTLEKDRNRRYETANGLGRDIQRYLADESVEACPPSVGYRVRKFVRRNRGTVIAAAAIFLTLIAGIIGTSLGLFEAGRQRDEAKKRLVQIEKGNEILSSIFKNLNPEGEAKGDKSLRVQLGEHLTDAVKQLEGEAIGDPIVVAKLQKTLGESLLALGYPEQALELFSKAHKTLTSLLNKDHPDVIDSIGCLAAGYGFTGRYDLATPLQEEAFALSKTVLGKDHRETIKAANNVAVCYLETGNTRRAIELLDETLKLSRIKLGPDDKDTLLCMDNLGVGYMTISEFEKAIPLVKTVYERRQQRLGGDHTDTLTSMNNLASCYMEMGNVEMGLPLLEQSVHRVEKKLGPNHPNTIRAIVNLAKGYQRNVQSDKALPLFEQCLIRTKEKLGIEHHDTLNSMVELAGAYKKAGNLEQSIALLKQAAECVEKKQFKMMQAQNIVESLCECYEDLRQYDLAEMWRRKWLAVEKSIAHPNPLPVISAQAKLCRNLLKQKKYSDAEALLSESLEVLKRQSPEHWQIFHLSSMLGESLLGQKRYKEAGPLIESGYQGFKRCDEANVPKENKPNASYYEEAQQRVIQLYEETNQKDKVREWRARFFSSEAAIVKTVDEFLKKELTLLNSSKVELKAKIRAFQAAAERVNNQFKSQPRVEAAIRESIGNALVKLGDFRSAQPQLEQAVKLYKQELSEEHTNTHIAMNNLSETYRVLGEYTNAENLYLKILNILKNKLGDENEDTATAMNNLATVYTEQGKLDAAEPLLVKALATFRRIKGEEATITLSVASNLAMVYQAQRRYTQSIPLYESLLATMLRVYGERNQDTLNVMNNLGAAYKELRQFEKTEPLFTKALRLRKELLGDDHPDAITSLNNLASLYSDQGQYALAEPHFEKALAGVRRVWGENHPNTKTIKGSLAGVYSNLARYDQAEPLLRELLESSRTENGQSSPELAGALATLSLALVKQMKYAEAEPLLRECLTIREKKQPDDWRTFNTKSMLGGCLLGLKKYSEAQPLLLDGYEGMKQREARIPPQGKIRLPEAMERIVQLYEATNQQDEARSWREKLNQTKPPDK